MTKDTHLTLGSLSYQSALPGSTPSSSLPHCFAPVSKIHFLFLTSFKPLLPQTHHTNTQTTLPFHKGACAFFYLHKAIQILPIYVKACEKSAIAKNCVFCNTYESILFLIQRLSLFD